MNRNDTEKKEKKKNHLLLFSSYCLLYGKGDVTRVYIVTRDCTCICHCSHIQSLLHNSW